MCNVELIKYLSGFVSEARYDLFSSIIDNRTRYLTVVLEDIYQAHNASAVLRTCECYGLQDVYVIENKNVFNPNKDISMGSSKWLSINNNIKKPQNTCQVVENLKKNGYRIVGTSPLKSAVNINDFDLTNGKAAFLFGTELTGLSPEAMSMCDEFINIPMFGFTESFNISVSVAIILSKLVEKMRSINLDWHLNSKEKEDLMLEWLKKSIKSSDKIIEKYIKANCL